MRFVCGVRGYEFIRSFRYPLPAYRTLCDRVHHAPFLPGVQHDIVQWLQCKMQTMNELERDCVLMLDEMQTRKALEYDKGLCSYLGQVTDMFATSTANSDVVLASHALVFMVRGLSMYVQCVMQ